MTRTVMALIVLLVTMAAGASDSGVVILHDSGHTRQLAPYLAPFETPVPEAMPAHSQAVTEAPDLAAMLPIRTPELTPGTVMPRPWPRTMAAAPTRPVFLIGADERSRHWLARHRDELAESGAVGLIVQAETLIELEALAELARGIPLTPASGSDLARLFDLRHIPVLISRRGIWQ